MSLTKIFGEKGAFKVLFAPNFILLMFYLQGSYEFCQSPTVDGSEIHNNHPTCVKPCIYLHILTISTGFLAGFLNHQQYVPRSHGVSYFTNTIQDIPETHFPLVGHSVS